MVSLVFGIAAALAWGVHDVLVRFVSARVGAGAAYLAVLGIGLVVLSVLFALAGLYPNSMSPTAAALAAGSGLVYALGGYSLYRAFQIGPVRMVAPIIGSYPVLSLGFATLQGQPPSLGQLIAVVAIIAGVALIAVLSDHERDAAGSRREALLWSALGCGGFAVTFVLGQRASLMSDQVSTVLLSRLAGFIGLGLALSFKRERLSLRGAPFGTLVLMGACDACALGMVQAAGSLPRPEFASVASSVFGMVTIILAWAFLKERMSAPQWGAVAIVFAGIGYLGL